MVTKHNIQHVEFMYLPTGSLVDTLEKTFFLTVIDTNMWNSLISS